MYVSIQTTSQVPPYQRYHLSCLTPATDDNYFEMAYMASKIIAAPQNPFDVTAEKTSTSKQ